jgi:hypothetical protein
VCLSILYVDKFFLLNSSIQTVAAQLLRETREFFILETFKITFSSPGNMPEVYYSLRYLKLLKIVL